MPVGATVVKARESELEGFVPLALSKLSIQPLVRRHGPESQAFSRAGIVVFAVLIPFSLESGTVPLVLSTKFPVTFTTSFDSTSVAAAAARRAALSAGHKIEIDVQGSREESWERLEDLLTKGHSRRARHRSHHPL